MTKADSKPVEVSESLVNALDGLETLGLLGFMHVHNEVFKPHCCYYRVRKDWHNPVSGNNFKYVLEQTDTSCIGGPSAQIFGSPNALPSESTLQFFSILVIAQEVAVQNFSSALITKYFLQC